MGSHVFVDETKSRGYTLIAVEARNDDVARLRKSMRALLLPGQERVHFRKESPSRRKTMLARLARRPLEVLAIHSELADEAGARAQCLEALVNEYSSRRGSVHLVVEQDDSLLRSDTRHLMSFVFELPPAQHVTFEITPPRLDAGLWCADAIGWALQRGGDWKRRVSMHRITTIGA